ncbi:hypothetical protein N7526_004567 [Penicillium atrosanguineum]|nr:hypothetical protein N7526_004567 [Penicillium atrosanguineum]
MAAARVSRLSWTVPPAALAAYTVGDWAQPNRRMARAEQKAYFTKGLAKFDTNSELRGHTTGKTDSQDSEDQGIWLKITQKLDEVKNTVGSADLGSNISSYIPDWARLLPATAQKLQRELALAPGSLADEIWQEAHDPELNPEITRDARVRVSGDLCAEEQAFRKKRQQHALKALASYLDIPVEDIHPDDVPVIAMCGSGGGLRALVAGTGSYLAAQESGRNFHKLVDHLKNRLGVHIAFPPAALNLLTTAPTNKYLLSGFIEKLKGDPGADFGLVDIYGLLLAARLMVPRGELGVSDSDLKLSTQAANLYDGAHPLPIYTAVRHEIPLLEAEHNDETKGPNNPEEAIREAKKEAWFQWFEFTPFEFFCEELNAGIPTWALGRHFDGGRSVLSPENSPIPELRVPGLMGIWGSAFCATLSHYYKEIRPLVVGLAGFGGIDTLIQGKNQDLVRVHPIDPAAIPNFSIFNSSHLNLMDAGMSNNLPIYPLIRPGRDVDVILAFDASADIKQENWLSVVDGYARQRGIKGWPIGAGWPRESETLENAEKALREPQGITDEKANKKLTDAQSQDQSSETDLSYCNVWVGTQEERISEKEPPPSKRLFQPQHIEDHSESEFHLMRKDAGIAVVYSPLIPNPSAPDLPSAPETRPRAAVHSMNRDYTQTKDAEKPLTPRPSSIDPDKDDFLSTWNFIYTPEQIDSVVGLAKANFNQGHEQTRRVVRAVYERKKSDRLQKEEEESRKRMEGFVPL